jgi:hypothetical protein
MRSTRFVALLLAVWVVAGLGGNESLQSMSAVPAATNSNALQVYESNNFLINLRAFLHFIRSIKDGVKKLVGSLWNGAGRSGSYAQGGECGGSIRDQNLIWGGVAATAEEVEAISLMQTEIDNFLGRGSGEGSAVDSSKAKSRMPLLKRFGRSSGDTGSTAWLGEATELEYLRYLRRSKGKRDDAFKAMVEHSKWRAGKHGIDAIRKNGEKRFPPNHPLHREVFWLGVAKDNTATLVVRTQAHDGRDYNEDPQEFVDFIVHVLEKGREKYKLGSERQVTLLLDRANYVRQQEGVDEEKVPYKLDMGVVPRLVELMKKLFGSLHANYADLLTAAKVVPVSTFFSMCYRVTSRAMDRETRQKFTMVKEKDLLQEIHKMHEADVLPPHLGGHSKYYGPWELSSTEICGQPGSCDGIPSVSPIQEPISE